MILDKKTLARETRKQRRLEALGSNNPSCGACGEADWRCLELHHVADRQRDETTVALCRNCHRKATDDQKDHPALDPNADPLLDRIGHFLLGLAALLRILFERLQEFGTALIDRAGASVGSVSK